MKSKVITYNFDENFICRLVDYIQEKFSCENKCDLSKLAIIFPGKRPSLFVKKQLAVRINTTFYPPKFFSIDEFINYIIKKHERCSIINDLDACYTIYNLTKKIAPEILKYREKFSQFLTWSKEIKNFIDEIDLEVIKNESLKNIRYNAEIGYEVPDSINQLLMNIIFIREAYHKKLRKHKMYSRGLKYNIAAEIISNVDLSEFDRILFCNFFYLNKSEEKIIKNLYYNNKAVLLFQKDNNSWPILDKLAKNLSCEIKPVNKAKKYPNIIVERGFDIHSQVALVREKLKKIKNIDDTVIVLPNSNNLIPLLSEISNLAEDFNISMGYPINRTTVYSLFSYIFKAQSSIQNNKYYAKDYLKVIAHPLIKNLAISSNSSITRILVHKIEEILTGEEKTNLSGSLFIDLKKIETHKDLYSLVISTLQNMEIETDLIKLKKLLKSLHFYGFELWRNIKNFSEFSESLNEFLNLLIDKSFVDRYPLNLKIIDKIFSIKDKLKNSLFCEEEFNLDDIFKIFDSELENELISFYGSPLKGLQILGLFETRALSFKNVIVMDVNESILPKLKVYEPLIPRPVMVNLGLNRLEKEEEIQRYHFMRIISSAENVYLIYNDSSENIKSRFIEELIWNKQKQHKKLSVFSQPQAKFKTQILSSKKMVKKTPFMIEILKNLRYSPTSIDTYLNCPLRFYYQYILKLNQKEEMLEEPKGADIGSFIHEILEESFSKFLGKKPILDEKFKKRFFKIFDKKFESTLEKRLGSEAFMVKDVMKYRLGSFLEEEKQRNVEKLISLEESSLGGPINFDKIKINFKCVIDRLDKLENGTFLIIDYKTGMSAKSPKSIEKISDMKLEREEIKNNIRSFQLPIYYYFVRQHHKNVPLNAVLYNLKTLKQEKFVKDIKDADKTIKICLKALEYIIKEIIDVEKYFYPDTTEPNNCKYCSFSYLCI